MLSVFRKWAPGRMFTGAPADPNRRRHFEKSVEARRKANRVARKARKRNARV